MDYLFPLIAAVIWGGNAIVSKASAGVIAPAEIAFYRWLLALLLLTPFVLRPILANWRIVGANLHRFFFLGILGYAVFPVFMYMAATYTSAIHIGLIQSLMPLFSLGLSVALLGHRATYGALAGGVVSLAGVAIVVTHGHPTELFTKAPNTGDMLMLAAAACYALYSVLLKHWRPQVPLLQSLYVQGVGATITLLPFFLLSDRHGLDATNLPLVGYAGALASIVAPLVWMHGIGRIGPARAALFFNLVPVVAAALAVAILSEHLTMGLILGGGLTIGGVLIAERWRTPLTNAARNVTPAQ